MTEDYEEPIITRREALKGGSAAAVAAGAALYSNALIRRAQAATSGDPRILMEDAAVDPDEAGEIVRNGSDLKAYSGGAARNLSNIGSGGLVPLRSVTASSQATVDFDQGDIDNTRRVYYIELSGVAAGNDSVTFYLRVSNDGGSTYQSGAGDYSWVKEEYREGGAGGNNGTTEGQIRLVETIGNDTGEELSGLIRISTPAQSGSRARFEWNISNTRPGGNFSKSSGAGQYNTAEDAGTVRLYFSSGNVASGDIDLYGVEVP